MTILRRQAVEINLDPLVDMMSQGVGILIVVMAVAQLATGDALRRIKAAGDLAEVSPAELAAAREDERKLSGLVADLRRQWNLKPRLSARDANAELSQLQELMAELQRLLQLPPELTDKERLAAIDAAQQRRLGQLRGELAAARQQLTSYEAELAGLVASRPKPKELRVPANREAPAGLKPKLFACRHGRVFPRNDLELAERLTKAISAALQDRKLTVADVPRVERYFEENDVGDAYWRVKLKFDKRLAVSGGTIVATHEPVIEILPRRADQGETPDELLSPGSAYLRSLGARQAEDEFRKSKTAYPESASEYVRFLVWADSFDTYLAARKLSDERGFYAGWHPLPKNFEVRVPLSQTGGTSPLGEIDN